MRTFKTLGTALMASALLLASALSSPAVAAEPEEKLNVVLLGDSYSSGNGAGSYDRGKKEAYRSSVNWAQNYVSSLNAQGVHTTFKNLAHSGHKTTHLLEKGGQIDNVPSNTDLVMLTIGGNDIDFGQIVKKCFTAVLRDPTSCQKYVDAAQEGLDGVIDQTEKIFARLSERLKPGAEVVLVGYPLLSTTRDYRLVRCISYSAHKRCSSYVTYDAGAKVRALGQTATHAQQALVDKWNTANSMKVTYVDSIMDAFAGHEPDPALHKRNDYRWVNEFTETEGDLGTDGKTRGRPSLNWNNWYHPNILGHKMIAVEVEDKIGIPASAQIIGDRSEDIDIVFAVDATGPAAGAIDTLKENVSTIAEQIHAQSNSYRFALVTYRDHADNGEDMAHSPPKLELGFTSDIAAFEEALANIKIDDGEDTAQSDYSGIMEDPQLDWRLGVKKIAIALSDTHPKDREPITGFAQSAAEIAFDIDPAEIYAINKNFLASSSRDIPELIIETITTALDKPFSWLQGPIIGTINTSVILDARGSYAANGPVQTYEWDFDGDGEYDLTTSDGITEHTYTEPFEGVASVRVTAADGSSSVGSAPVSITVEPEPELEPELQLDQEGVYEVLDGDPLPFEVEPGNESEASLTLSVTEIEQGGTLNVIGTNLPSNTEVQIQLIADAVQLAATSTDASGDFTQAVAIPANTPPGAHQIAAIYSDTTLYADITVIKANQNDITPTDDPTNNPAESPSEPSNAPTGVAASENEQGNRLANTGVDGTTLMSLVMVSMLLIFIGVFVRRHSKGPKA